MTDSTNSSIKMPIRRMNVDELDNNTTALFNTQRTNCITEIPQDIKLELLNGELKVLAGTKVYVPNSKNTDGSNKFDVVTITSDMQISPSGYASLKHILCALPNNRIQLLTLDTQQYSGSAAPSGQQYMFWYDTANNYVKYTADSGSTWQSGWCLPLAIVTIAYGTGVTSIDQVFNGFGYIGSTMFTLPAVKGLIPNGRNEDGSLKNIEFTTSSVLTFTNTYVNVQNAHWLITSSVLTINGAHSYNEAQNLNYNQTTAILACEFAISQTDSSGSITNWNPKTIFHALDWNDSSTISGWSMPSDQYIDLALGATDSSYTAPANGYLYLAKVAGVGGKFNSLQNQTTTLGTDCWGSDSTSWCRCYIPVRKGDVVKAQYNTTGDTKAFCFIYAEGKN